MFPEKKLGFQFVSFSAGFVLALGLPKCSVEVQGWFLYVSFTLLGPSHQKFEVLSINFFIGACPSRVQCLSLRMAQFTLFRPPQERRGFRAPHVSLAPGPFLMQRFGFRLAFFTLLGLKVLIFWIGAWPSQTQSLRLISGDYLQGLDKKSLFASLR